MGKYSYYAAEALGNLGDARALASLEKTALIDNSKGTHIEKPNKELATEAIKKILQQQRLL